MVIFLWRGKRVDQLVDQPFFLTKKRMKPLITIRPVPGSNLFEAGVILVPSACRALNKGNGIFHLGRFNTQEHAKEDMDAFIYTLTMSLETEWYCDKKIPSEDAVWKFLSKRTAMYQAGFNVHLVGVLVRPPPNSSPEGSKWRVKITQEGHPDKGQVKEFNTQKEAKEFIMTSKKILKNTNSIPDLMIYNLMVSSPVHCSYLAGGGMLLMLH